MRKIIGIIATVTLMATSCTRPPAPSSASVKADSLTYIETVRIDTVKVPGDKVPFFIQAACEPTGKPLKYSTRGKTASVTIEVDSAGNISGTAACDSLEYYLHQYEKYLIRSEKYLETRESDPIKHIEIIEVHTPRWYDIMCRWIAIFAVLWLSFKLFVQPRFSGKWK